MMFYIWISIFDEFMKTNLLKNTLSTKEWEEKLNRPYYLTFVFRCFCSNYIILSRRSINMKICCHSTIYCFMFYQKIYFQNTNVLVHNFISYFACRSMCLSVRQLRARVKDKHWECHLTWLSNNMFLLPSKSMIVILIFLFGYISYETELILSLSCWYCYFLGAVKRRVVID